MKRLLVSREIACYAIGRQESSQVISTLLIEVRIRVQRPKRGQSMPDSRPKTSSTAATTQGLGRPSDVLPSASPVAYEKWCCHSDRGWEVEL